MTEPGDDIPATRIRKTRPDRRAEITAAALICLKTEGYAALTARKVAAAAGLSLGHLTYSFRDMDEVLAEAYRAASGALQQTTQGALDRAGADAEARLWQFLQAGFAPAILEQGYLRMRVDLWSAALTHVRIAETERALYDRYRLQLITLLQDWAPEAAGMAVQAVADAVMAMLDGLWLDYLRRGDRQAIDNGLFACLDLARLRLGPARV
jgi:TetR/AcrR family transcriptional regulator, transcriptional repressor of bet genes